MTTDNRENKYLTREKLKQQIAEDSGWYFITYIHELPSNRPYSFTLFNEPFVLFKDKNDNFVCFLLLSLDETKKSDSVGQQSFKVVEKQGEIWFNRKKTQS